MRRWHVVLEGRCRCTNQAGAEPWHFQQKTMHIEISQPCVERAQRQAHPRAHLEQGGERIRRTQRPCTSGGQLGEAAVL